MQIFWKTTADNVKQSYSGENKFKVEGDSKAFRRITFFIHEIFSDSIFVIFPSLITPCTPNFMFSVSPSTSPLKTNKQTKEQNKTPKQKRTNKTQNKQNTERWKNIQTTKPQETKTKLGVHFVLTKYWIWGLPWNVANSPINNSPLDRTDFLLPSRYRLKIASWFVSTSSSLCGNFVWYEPVLYNFICVSDTLYLEDTTSDS